MTAEVGEGTVFAVPYDKERWVRGILARFSGRTALGYFIGPPLAAEPELEDFAGMTVEESVFVCRVNDAGFRHGQWTALGVMPGFERDRWPIPKMAERNEVGGFAWIYDYGDDIGAEPSEERVDIEQAGGIPAVDLYMAGAVERQLWRQLKDW